MNLTTTGRISTWKRLKMQYVLATAGVALAVSGAIAVTSLDVSSPVPSAAPASSKSTWDLRPIGPQVIYLLAGSPEQADTIRQGVQVAAGERESTGMPGPAPRVVVLTPLTEQEVLALRAAVANAGQEDPSGSIYEIIDLRGK